MKTPSSLQSLMEALRILPGVGPKSAQRMAYHLLEHERDGALRLSVALHDALGRVHHCEQCNTFTEEQLCEVCAGPRREVSLL